jgi:hypothetical protein
MHDRGNQARESYFPSQDRFSAVDFEEKVMARWLSVSCLVVLLYSGRHAAGQEDARNIIQKAITAAGGADKIDRYKGLQSSARGTAQLSGITAEFTSQTTIALPDRMKIVAKYQALGSTFTLEQKVIGDRVTATVNGSAVPLSDGQKAEVKAAFVRTEILRLTPLLAGKQYTLKALGESKLAGKEYVGVSVSGRGVTDLRLYFDKSTSLLSRYEMRTTVGTKEMKRVTTLSEYKEAQGLKRPTRMTVTLDGKQTMDVTTTEEKLVEKIDDKEFKE